MKKDIHVCAREIILSLELITCIFMGTQFKRELCFQVNNSA